MVYKLITPPTALALTLEDAKGQLNIDLEFTLDDLLIESYIHAAAAFVEKRIQGALMAQTWEAQLADFKSCIELLKSNISDITSVKYYDSANADITVGTSNYQKDLASVPARLIFNSSYAWPTVYDRFDAIRVGFTAGFASAAAVPYDIRIALKMLVTHYYENRSPEVVGASIAQFELSVDKHLANHMLWV